MEYLKVFLSAPAIISSLEYEGERPELNYNYDEREISRFQTLLLLAALLYGLLDLTEGAKGYLRAGPEILSVGISLSGGILTVRTTALGTATVRES